MKSVVVRENDVSRATADLLHAAAMANEFGPLDYRWRARTADLLNAATAYTRALRRLSNCRGEQRRVAARLRAS